MIAEAEFTRADIIEALAYQLHAARREFPVVGTQKRPTPWDRRHRQLDELLTNLQLLEEYERVSEVR